MTAETYSAYADRVTDPRFTDWLRDQSQPDWDAAVEHRFVTELGGGTLDEDAFAAYLRQDYAFVDELVGTFGHAVGQAPDMAAKRRFVEFLDTVTDEEDDYFERSFDALGVDESRWQNPDMTETTAAFVDLLGRAAREGGYAETLAVLVPAEWIYESWATAAADTHGDPDGDGLPSAGMGLPFYFAEWVDLHAVDSFVAFVEWLRGELDAVGPTLSPRREARVASLFDRTVTLERQFFETAYEETPATAESEVSP
ncbi:transcriptional regulator [Haloarcula sp. CBA1130]|uniref:TenA family protein n=1 Tax=unclassified Haloarcula TaxID=2624677 RepID=UPI0012485054|nr:MULTISPECIES: TenA family protein [unclassified Haloarcula]KAA9396893.1 transcriptional regulator [Haloarcula sp. CBA1129]KAA9401853.1 transcriptional regulator [Haloarcula sp. CBA1130]